MVVVVPSSSSEGERSQPQHDALFPFLFNLEFFRTLHTFLSFSRVIHLLPAPANLSHSTKTLPPFLPSQEKQKAFYRQGSWKSLTSRPSLPVPPRSFLPPLGGLQSSLYGPQLGAKGISDAVDREWDESREARARSFERRSADLKKSGNSFSRPFLAFLFSSVNPRFPCSLLRQRRKKKRRVI